MVTFNRLIISASILSGILLQTSNLLAAGPPEMPPVPIMAELVRAGGVGQQLLLTGTVEAVHSTSLAAEMEAVVDEIFVEEGDHVTTGTALVQMRMLPLKLDMDAAEARMRQSEQRVLELKNGTRLEDLAVAEADYQEAKVAFDIAAADNTRYEELFKSNTISESERDASRNRFEAARARAESLKAILDRAKAGAREEELGAAVAAADADRAAFELAKDRHERGIVRAPFSGVITRRFVSNGAWVGKADPLVSIDRTDVVQLRVEVPEREFSRISEGWPTTVTLDAYPQRTWDSTVTRRIPRADNRSRAFPVLIEMNNKEGLFSPGMLARVNFAAAPSITNAVLMPKDAIVPEGPTPVVFRVDKRDGKAFAQRLEVKTGRFFGLAVEVFSDELKAGDLVVTRGNERLRPDQELSVNAFVTTAEPYSPNPADFFNETAGK